MNLHLTRIKAAWIMIKKSLKNPLVVSSLILGVLGAPPIFYSGVYMGKGEELIGGLLFLAYVVIYTIDALVTLTLIINR